MQTSQIAMKRDLTRDLADVLSTFERERVSVRVVTADDDLIAVFAGTLGPRSDEKAPSLFWPIECDSEPGELERPGIWVHPAVLEEMHVHTGGFVVEFRQGGVTVNVRRLGSAGS
jgi:hypothetical protein